jgi:mannose-6-phosphate isomerase
VPSHPPIVRVIPAVRDYAWGSRTALAELRGEPGPTPDPEAEAWFGAHPGAPSGLADGGTLADLVAADPDGALGQEVVGRCGPRLPFLVKLLAAASPLSLQAHPTTAQAEAGFDAEEARGIPRDAPTRVYRDRSAKPELLLALTPFAALCGFRGVEDTVSLLEALDVPGLRWLATALRDDGEAALAGCIASSLRGGPGTTDQLDALGEALRTLAAGDGCWAREARWIGALLDRYPGDGGVLVALLLRLVELAPGQAVHLPAGNLHAYLRGTGVEVMATSDNVVRGGLTPKHVDVEELLHVLDPRVLPPPIVTPVVRDGWTHLPTPTPDFALSHRELVDEEVAWRTGGRPQLVLVTGGSVTVQADGVTVTVPPAGGAFVPASTDEVTARGAATLHRVTVGP